MKRAVGERWNSSQIAVFVGLIVLAVILLNVTNYTGSNATVTGQQVTNIYNDGAGNQVAPPSGGSSGGTSFIADLFANWSSGQLDINIAKYLFLIILTALIFSTLSFAKFPDSTFLQALLAVPIGFLITAYITPEELFTILTAYSALGMTLSVIIPFVILLFFSAMLLSNEKISSMTVAKIVLEVVLWFLFCGFLFYKLIAGYGGASLSTGASIVMFAAIALSLAILFLNKHFRKWVRSLGLEIKRAKSEVESEARDLERKAGMHEDRS